MLPDTRRGLRGCDHNVGVRMSVPSWEYIYRPYNMGPPNKARQCSTVFRFGALESMAENT